MAMDSDKITENAEGPKIVRNDTGMVEQHDPTKQIEVDKYDRAKNAVTRKGLGLRMTRFRPGGTA
tara:strand:- start:271 stop:465 length:195 start_codon:yes stop_codon:yes gene_type:complete